jgi:hypothetical protein
MLDIIDQYTNKGVNVIENASFGNFGNYWQKGNGTVVGHGFDNNITFACFHSISRRPVVKDMLNKLQMLVEISLENSFSRRGGIPSRP